MTIKDFWFRSIWIDLRQALTIDRECSQDRAPVGLIRCICKDDQVKGPNAPVKFKLSNIHAFVPIWMAPTMLRNLRLIAAQSSPLSELGQLDYREGWFAIVPKEGETGESLCGIPVRLSDINLATFPNRGWPAMEHWAERGLLKPDVWRARRTNLSLKIKIEIPVSGASIQIQQHALKLDQVPDSWPCNLESGWTAKYGRLDMTFEDMCQHLIQSHFTSDAFQGGPDSYLFKWDADVWDTWPQGYEHKFWEDWDTEGHIYHPKRSSQVVTAQKKERLRLQTPDHTELVAPIDDFMRCQFDNRGTSRAQEVVPVLRHRLTQSAQMRGALAQMVHAISRNFTMKDTNQIMDQLIQRCRGNLTQYMQNSQLMLAHCVEIVQSLGLVMLDEMQVVDSLYNPPGSAARWPSPGQPP